MVNWLSNDGGVLLGVFEMINTIILGHALNVLPKLPAESVSCVITSPPYWGLRDYGIAPVIWDGGKDCKHA